MVYYSCLGKNYFSAPPRVEALRLTAETAARPGEGNDTGKYSIQTTFSSFQEEFVAKNCINTREKPTVAMAD